MAPRQEGGGGGALFCACGGVHTDEMQPSTTLAAQDKEAGTHGMQAFGQHSIRSSEIFFRSALSCALVNLKPILPGHVLVIPRRRLARLADLTAEEVSDLFATVQRVGSVIERVYNGTALTIALQDGQAAGQSVTVSNCLPGARALLTAAAYSTSTFT